jgi:hypothetical protein
MSMVAAQRITLEELADAATELLAFRFIAGGLDPQGTSDPSVLRERLAALDNETSAEPFPWQTGSWGLLLLRSEALGMQLGTERSQERRLAAPLAAFEAMVAERIQLEDRRPGRVAPPEWHVERRELEGRIDRQLKRVFYGIGVVARWLAWSEAE